MSGRPKWLSRDPIGENGGLNLYGYAGNNPVNFLDPLGLKYAEMYAAYGVVGGGAAAAAGSVAVDAVTGGVNVLATPAEIAGGAAIGGILGYDVGKLMDIITGNADTPAIPIVVNAKNPDTAAPGSEKTCPQPNGTPKQIRRYGPDGYPETDTDCYPDHGQGTPHVHDWVPSPNGGPPVRGPGRPPQPGDPGIP